MKIDVHGLRVQEAMNLIRFSIDQAVARRELTLEITHGFHGGARIQHRVLRLSAVDHPAILRVRSKIDNPGISIVELRWYEE
jgi:DNA-nicking Smr family endonuclease